MVKGWYNSVIIIACYRYTMEKFVEYIVRNLVDDPDKVKVNCLEGRSGLLVEIRVEKSDIGKVVGNQGRTINALRSLVFVLASRMNKRVRLEIIE